MDALMRALAMAGLLMPVTATATTPAELAALLDAGETVTLVDIRQMPYYQRDHIPGSLHMTPSVIGHKRLPALGLVVVVGDGIDTATTKSVVAELASREGIDADLLEGGFPAWKAHGALTSTTQKPFEASPQIRWVSYAQLRDAVREDGRELVIVDLRTVAEPTRLDDADIRGVTVVRAPADADDSVVLRRILSQRAQLTGRGLVLVDDGNDRAVRIAQKLQVAGLKLVGGDKALSARGVEPTVTMRQEARP
jgi:rhodanese-related sulfurtransferase